MPFQLFQYALPADPDLTELNSFLLAHRVATVQREIVTTTAGPLLLFNVEEWNQCRYGVPFLGFVIYPDRMRLGRQGRRRLGEKMRSLQPQFREDQISELEYQSRCTSLFAHAQTADDVNWRRTVLSFGHCPPGD